MTCEFHGMGPLLHFFCCEMSSFIRSNVVQNIMKMDKASYESMNGGGSRSIIGKESKSIPKYVSIPVKRSLSLSMREVVQYNQQTSG